MQLQLSQKYSQSFYINIFRLGPGSIFNHLQLRGWLLPRQLREPRQHHPRGGGGGGGRGDHHQRRQWQWHRQPLRVHQVPEQRSLRWKRFVRIICTNLAIFVRCLGSPTSEYLPWMPSPQLTLSPCEFHTGSTTEPDASSVAGVNVRS